MNYRHEYHAGNFADCFKHALLVLLLDALGRKATPYFVLDTHAGAGYYDLAAEAALRTREANAGIRRLLESRPACLHRYLGIVDALGTYPGSPAIIRHLMREDDRLACCELLPDAVSDLRRLFAHDDRVQVHQRSGWEGVGALLPPGERRGLVFVDPPFEDRAEFDALKQAVALAHRRFANGVLAGWYPIKRLTAVRAFHAAVGGVGIRDVVAVEIWVRALTDPSRFNGCGLLVVNPPFRFEDQAGAVARAVLEGLGSPKQGAGVDVIRIADE